MRVFGLLVWTFAATNWAGACVGWQNCTRQRWERVTGRNRGCRPCAAGAAGPLGGWRRGRPPRVPPVQRWRREVASAAGAFTCAGAAAPAAVQQREGVPVQAHLLQQGGRRRLLRHAAPRLRHLRPLQTCVFCPCVQQTPRCSFRV